MAGRIAQRQRRLIVIKAYGNKCKCCKENRTEFLCIDHIKGNGDGRRHRKKVGNTIKWLYKQLVKGKIYKSRFRVLCHNCNLSLGFYGYCPHKNKKVKI
jgi:hypothetical protein